MAVTHVSKIYAVEDCKIAKLTADASGASAATYASLIDVPGIKTVEISGTVDTKPLRGDNQLLDSISSLTAITAAIAHAKLSLDVLPVLLGGTTTSSTFDLLGTDTLNFFKLEAKTPSNGADPVGGDVHFVLHKCMISAMPSIGNAEEDYRIVSFEVTCSPLISTSKWITAKINDTALAIS